MLIKYRKEQKKIAMGLLSFHEKLVEYQDLLKEVDTYEQNEVYQLFFWIPENQTNIQGILGLEWETNQTVILHDIAINPSFRGESYGFHLLNEFQETYPEVKILPTKASYDYFVKWQHKIQ